MSRAIILIGGFIGIAILLRYAWRAFLRWKFHISAIPSWYYKETFRTVQPYLGKFTSTKFDVLSLKGYIAGHLTYVSGIVVCDGIDVPYFTRWAGKKLTYVRIAEVKCYYDEDGENAYLDRKEKRNAKRR